MNRKLVVAVVFVLGAVAGVGGSRLSPFASAKPLRPAQAPAPDTGQAPAAVKPAMVEDATAVYRVPIEKAPVRGPADALVTLVEVVDFECPYCKRAAPTVRRLEQEYQGKVRVVFKHNPLGGHRNAVPAAKLAEEARAQGGDAKFWAAHDKLLELGSLDRPALVAAGAALRLDAARVEAGLDGPRHIDAMREDQTMLSAIGVTGTPTFLVNGRKLVGAVPYEQLKAVIDAELVRATRLAAGSGR